MGASNSQNVAVIEQTFTVDTNAFSAGDLIGAAAIEFAQAVLGLESGLASGNAGGGAGFVTDVTVKDLAKQSANLELWLFDSTPGTDVSSMENNAFDPDDADLAKRIGVVPINTWYEGNDNAIGVGTVPNGRIGFVATESNSIYGFLVSRGTPTYGASDLSVQITVLRV